MVVHVFPQVTLVRKTSLALSTCKQVLASVQLPVHFPVPFLRKPLVTNGAVKRSFIDVLGDIRLNLHLEGTLYVHKITNTHRVSEKDRPLLFFYEDFSKIEPIS